ncbi:hypothetical protein [Lewinella sp. W8]|uniref:nSTAND1 domain-containing NTPase n=1 Tax=Lewinella sp. W8 TaxID=2528208 RepID=UPI0010684CB0|nr:hypothetical protein [Lewinella sp. W8]MTB52955.1 hypothetical protein [Lewinella sp. W8]
MSSVETQVRSLFFDDLKSEVTIDREEALLDVYNQLTAGTRFVALRGDSGSGKSFFLKRQLIPHFERKTATEKEGSGEWKVVHFTPQINPIGRLASALAKPGILQAEKIVQPFFHERISAALRADNEGLIRVIREAREAATKPFRLLIIVDQVEEMFRIGDARREQLQPGQEIDPLAYQPGDRVLFFNLFLEALQEDVPVNLVFSISTEYLDRLNTYQGWPELVSMHRYSLPTISTRGMANSLYHSPDPGRIHPGCERIYQGLITEYRDLIGKKRELATRVNMMLCLLAGKSDELLVTFFQNLEHHFDFITQHLRTLEEMGVRQTVQSIREEFRDRKNLMEWQQWLTELEGPSRERYEEQVNVYFNQLLKAQRAYGGLAEVPNHFCNHLLDTFRKSLDAKGGKIGTTLIDRLFRAVTLKDASPDRVAQNYSIDFATLREVCFRGDLLVDQSGDTPQKEEAGTEKQSKEAAKRQKDDLLRAAIATFSSDDHHLPNLINWATPFGKDVTSASEISDDIVINLGATGLIQEWKFFVKAVDREWGSSNFYKDLVFSAKRYFIDEGAKPPTENLADADRPDIPNISLFQQLWSWIRGLFKKEKTKSYRVEIPETALSLAEVDFYRDWKKRDHPNEAWANKYHPPEIFQPGEFDENPAIPEFIKEEKHTAFTLVEKYFEKSAALHQKNLDAEKRERKEELEEQQKRASRAIMVTIGMIGLSILAILFAVDADRTKKNLVLLDFVDSMAKANLLSSNIYRTREFRELKHTVETSSDIEDPAALIHFLARKNIIDLHPNPDNFHYQITHETLLDLDHLIDNYHQQEEQKSLASRILAWSKSWFKGNIANQPTNLEETTHSVLGNVRKALYENTANTSEINFQYPYMYHVLWENAGALNNHLDQEANRNGRGFLGNRHSRITAVASNSTKFEQIAIGDATGEITVFFLEDESVVSMTLPSINKSISSMAYSRDGKSLYVTSYSGTIHYFTGLDCPEAHPKENCVVAPGELNLTNNYGKALLSIRMTSDDDVFVVLRDNDVALLVPKRNGYALEQITPLVNSLKAVTLLEGNVSGTHFLAGGSAGSALYEYVPRIGNTGPRLVGSQVSHPGFSISAIAFQEDPDNNWIAMGGEDGRVWIGDIAGYPNGLKAQTDTSGISRRFHRSGVSGLIFNDRRGSEGTGNRQLISSSLDGTIWLYNLDQPQARPVPGAFYRREHTWDHLKLPANTRSKDAICLANEDFLISVENNTLRRWPTNLEVLEKRVCRMLERVDTEHECE